MLAALGVLSVVFWAWVIVEVTSDDDDDDEATSEETTIETVEEISVDEGENDLLMGTEGDDSLDAEEGVDIVFGDEGDDTLRGGEEGDLLLGGADDDELRGSEGEDTLVGGEGADTLIGGSGADILDGTSLLDEDTLATSAETANTLDDLVFQYDTGLDTDDGDVIQGRGGDDTIIMGSEDSVTGGAGEDLFSAGEWVRPGEPAIIEDYDEDEDIISYSYTGPTEPVISTTIDGTTDDVTVYADGQAVIIVTAAGPTFTADNIALLET
ncbi:calcium-binding protein [uncultured Shimia sp.]|uniref:calcium-binding protein n=1 Tax=uncultured Shimia sp. TaxID=573152 RepID=UPI002603C6D3|nr:calcium-binding protein [uncultured Shimia sp.]